jgi:hypothetical protein
MTEEVGHMKGMTMEHNDIKISGWYEADEGVDFIEMSEALDVNDLANKLLGSYGYYIIGVDMELEGEYTDGPRVNDVAVMYELERIGG